MMSPAWRISSAGMPASKHSLRAWNGWKPTSGSRCRRARRSGVVAATSSISMPPAVVSMRSGRFSPRSKVIEK